jgi:arabinan endo-1,5-alpha-L-arabinosidase
MGMKFIKKLHCSAIAIAMFGAVTAAQADAIGPRQHRPLDAKEALSLPGISLQAPSSPGKNMLTLDQIRIRDPFVLPVAAEQCYYMYASTGSSCPPGTPLGFIAFRSRDLQHWSEPIRVFDPPADFWATRDFWAPEVHAYQGKYYLFASLKAEKHYRGTQIFVADAPSGPFVPVSKGPVTPEHWECLDGTLFVAEDNTPYIVFCHEWLQIHNGSICAMPLSTDLSQAAGRPIYLFSATDAPWGLKRAFPAPGSKRNYPTYVTDGPFLHRSANGRLFMLWSSFAKGGYAVGIAESDNGRIDGNWQQQAEPLFAKDGGHAMIFRSFQNQLFVSLHAPNAGAKERAVFLEIYENAQGSLTVKH